MYNAHRQGDRIEPIWYVLLSPVQTTIATRAESVVCQRALTPGPSPEGRGELFSVVVRGIAVAVSLAVLPSPTGRGAGGISANLKLMRKRLRDIVDRYRGGDDGNVSMARAVR